MAEMIKTPEEIKKGLECDDCKKCPYSERNSNDGYNHCGEVEADALSLIQQLEAEKAELKRELGSAVMALATCAMDGLDGNICNYCTRKNCDEQDLHYECFEWRGPCEENGGVA